MLLSVPGSLRVCVRTDAVLFAFFCIHDTFFNRKCNRFGAKKQAAVQKARQPAEKALFCVLHSAALADDVDLDLAGVIQRILDLFGDSACQQDDLIVADDVGLD